MVDVTIHNFVESVNNLEKLIERRKNDLLFIAIDAEFTGLQARYESDSNLKSNSNSKNGNDTILETSLKRGSEYSMSQFGICLVFLDSKS